jgi:hypothetical protein
MANDVARIDDWAKDVAVFLSPSSRQREIAAYAVGALAAAQVVNRRALGRFPPYETTVDGRKGAALTTVNPSNGVIEFEFQFLDPSVLRWIYDQLGSHSPRLSGRYRSSHVLLADGVPVDFSGSTPSARQYTFTNTQPYARKIESGESSQATDGVYLTVAELAAKQFPDVKIRYGFVPVPGSVPRESSQSFTPTRGRNRRRASDWLSRQPAIIITDG